MHTYTYLMEVNAKNCNLYTNLSEVLKFLYNFISKVYNVLKPVDFL